MRLSAGVVLALALFAPAFGAGKKAAKKASPAVSTKTVLIQMERDWVHASATKDRAAVDRILADDWTSTDFHGKTVTKAQAMRELESATAGVVQIELGEMTVRMIGTTAIVTGRDRQGKYAWMDIFLKRDGRWQAVASQSTRIEP